MGVFRVGRRRAALVIASASALCGVMALGTGVATAQGDRPALADRGNPGRAAGQASGSAVASGGFSWHSLSLRDGWVGAVSDFSKPYYAVKGGVVYLTGSVGASSPSSAEFAMLPKGARPAHFLYITVPAGGPTSGYLEICPNGAMYAYDSPEDDAWVLTSLSGISFPRASLAAHALTLRNGWKSAQDRYSTGDPAYSISGGVVHLSGSVYQSTGSQMEFAVLPKAARPAHNILMSVYTFDGAVGALLIFSNGDLYAFSAGATQYTSLASVAYPVAGTTWHRLTLLNGWRPVQFPPSYAIVGGVVYLDGEMDLPAGTPEYFAALPKAARPANEQLITSYADENFGELDILPANGWVFTESPTTAAATNLTSLGGISYPAKS